MSETDDSGRSTHEGFTPALGFRLLTPAYDTAVRLLTREATWRDRLVASINPTRSDRILDVGCGTGTLAIALKAREPEVEVIGLDPDSEALRIARAKAEKLGVAITWRCSFLDSTMASPFTPVTKIVSSLVFHQTPLPEKSRILEEMYAIIEPEGSLHIADYGFQRTVLMRTLFRSSVQMLDGLADTQPNAEGCLPKLIEAAGFTGVREEVVVPTATGSISIYRARRPAT